MPVLRSALVLLITCASVQRAVAHGYMREPRARNYLSYLAGQYYCPQCGQGQGGDPGKYGLGPRVAAVYRGVMAAARVQSAATVSLQADSIQQMSCNQA